MNKTREFGSNLHLWLGTSASTHPRWDAYASEVLAHAGTTYSPCSSVSELPPGSVCVVTGEVDPEHREALTAWVHGGGALILTNGPGTLPDLSGATGGRTLESERITFSENPLWTQQPAVVLRALKGTALKPGDDVEVLATTSDDEPVLVQRRWGQGIVITFGVDLWYTIARIQQGYPVREDGRPAADGTAPIDDDILKCEDGSALNLDEDRHLPPGVDGVAPDFVHMWPPHSAVPLFTEPHADWWRSVFLQIMWHCSDTIGATIPWLGYWPQGMAAMAHMSHDADQNNTDDGYAALDAFAEAGVKVTWHQVFPGGYAPEVFQAITDAGHEQSLHYNAMADADLASWGWPQIRAQYAWAQAVTGHDRIVSNKNHYTRWEGWTEFYTWCEKLGIEIDSSRGPSKQGTAGFTFGTAHLSFPLSEEDATFHDVLNLPLHTQDLAWAQHISVRDVILDGAIAHHGVAHFLFHGPHLRLRPATRQACIDVAEAARERGLQWWTAEQLNTWERSRRGIRLALEPADGGWDLQVDAKFTVMGAAILLPLPSGSCSDDGVSVNSVQRHGREFLEVGVDLPAGSHTLYIRA